MIVLALLGCLRAVQPIPDLRPPTLEGRFLVELPDGWTVHRNRRALGNHHLALHAPDDQATVTIDLVREGRETRGLPLSLVADALATEGGRALGVISEQHSTLELMVADREAWAATVMRHHGPHSWLASLVVLRADKHLAILTLHALADANERVAMGWMQIVDSFELPYDPPPTTGPFLEDTRLEDELDAWEVGP